jgi:hypothetical protein
MELKINSTLTKRLRKRIKKIRTELKNIIYDIKIKGLH